MLWAVLLVLTHFDTFRERMPSFHQFFSFETVKYMWVAMGIVKVIHEFGHGLSCKRFGGEVHEMGFLILCLSPAMYCNVSDAWTLPSKWKRIIISFAGIYVELMIAAVATFVWWNTPGMPVVNYMAMCLMVICSVNTVFFNGNPLMKFDGYYVLADLIEIPNLREKANRYLQHIAMEYGLGMEMQPEPYMALGRRILFVTYALISWVYRWVVTFTILYFLSNFLKPYKLEVLSQMLAVFALGSLLGWPLVRVIQNVQKRGRVPDMKLLNTSITATVLAGILLAFFFLPLPVSRVRDTGLVIIKPTALDSLRIKADGFLKEMHVREGQPVRKGAILATFVPTQEQQRKLIELETEYSIQEDTVKDLKRQLNEVPGEFRSEVQEQLQEAESYLIAARQKKEALRQQLDDGRQLVATRDGVVIGLPKKKRLHEEWKKDNPEPFCQIGDPGQLQVLLPVSPDDLDLLSKSLASAKQHNWKLPVIIRIQGRDAQTWEGDIAELPQAVSREVPLQLTTKVGGPLAVKAGAGDDPLRRKNQESFQENKESEGHASRPDMAVPQNQIYLVQVNILNADSAIAPGALAQVKIYCEYRSGAWWCWRAINKTFDLGLM
jgi:putative peptide zinc metalloprotease protein